MSKPLSQTLVSINFVLVFTEAQNPQKALIAYERALLWREALELAIREGTEEAVIVDLAHRLAGMSFWIFHNIDS